MAKTYRYKIIKHPRSLDEAKLNEFGRRGWELCGVHEDEFGYKYYFKLEQE